jgi:PAS domain S-box-containing protein
VGRNWWEVFYPGEEYRQVEQLFRDFAKGDVRDYEMTLTTKSGGKRIVSWNSINRVDAAGSIVEVIGFGNDVTERRLAEQALKRSEERYALAQRAANIGSWDWNIETGDLHWSERIEPMFGFGPGEFAGTYEAFVERLHPDDRAFVQEAVRASVEEDKEYAIEHRIIWPDGTLRWLAETGDVFRNAEGKAVRMLGVVQDITGRKLAEERLRHTLAELERSNAELERFAYVVSHDLQEPLRMVSSFTQLLARRYRGRLDKDADEFIGFAVDGTRRMQRLLNDLLVYSRVTTQAKPLERTDLKSVLAQVLENLQLAIEEAGATITHDALPTVEADETQLIQLFQNLIGNALKFRGEQPPHIHVAATPQGGGWIFSVRDNGIGIAPDQQERIFEIFQRAHDRSKYAGTGIGLAICKRIVERHGGRIWVESQPETGATFSFTLVAQEGGAQDE